MVEVGFPQQVADEKMTFAVIIAKTQGQWVFCKHRKRDTFECPGGRREAGETLLQTAKRELYEETGAVDFDIAPVCAYSVRGKTRYNTDEDTVSYGMVYAAEIRSFEDELHSEIERIYVTDTLIDNWTYPDIQPLLIVRAQRLGAL